MVPVKTAVFAASRFYNFKVLTCNRDGRVFCGVFDHEKRALLEEISVESE